MLDSALTVALERRGLRPILVDDLGRDALVFTRYGLALLDRAAATSRAAELAEFIAAG